MQNIFVVVMFFIFSAAAHADDIPFKNPDGTTKWQHVANFSSSVLILTLLIVAIFLFFANRRAARSNRELTEIKATLEDRVARRTATLNETAANLKSREEYITSIVESMPLMLIGLNKNMEIIQWNQFAEAITGRPIASVLGKNLWDAYPGITLTPEQIQNVFKTKEAISIKHNQRDQYYFDITLYALTDKGETGIVILVDDITKQMKAESKVAERDKVSAMGELTSAMAYDINLPLQTILTTLPKAKNQLDASELITDKQEILLALDTAQKSGQQASAIIQNLLELAGSHHDEKQLTDIPQLMDRSIELASHLFADLSGLHFKNIDITRDYTPGLPQIPCFTSEVEQVFVRVLRNAFHSLNSIAKTNPEPPKIHVEISQFYDSLWIKVQHNGQALSPEAQQDIFQPYFAMTSNVPACPVEQRLSYSFYIITDHHHGQMAVTSNEHFGTTFNIQMPLV